MMTTCDTCAREVTLRPNGTRLAWLHVEPADHEPTVTDQGTELTQRAARRLTVALHGLSLGGPCHLLPDLLAPVVSAVSELTNHYMEHGGTFPGIERPLPPAAEESVRRALSTPIPDTIPEDWT